MTPRTDTPRPVRLGPIVAVLAVAGLLVMAIGAGQARGAGLPGPATFTTGLDDTALFESPSAAVRTRWFSTAHNLGSSAVRIDVDWAGVAPQRLPAGFNGANPAAPGYNWTAIDAAVRSAHAAGQTVLLMLYNAPTWAEAPHKPRYVTAGAWEPNAADYGQFAHAAALRYSGSFPDPLQPGAALPRVSEFQAWNEPNLPQYLFPQWVTGTGKSIVAASPGIYRALLNAFYAGVKSAQPNSFVIAGGTAPYGDPPGVDRMQPLTFIQGLLCLNGHDKPLSCPDPAHLDALDHHPYSLDPSIHAYVPGNLKVSDIYLLNDALRAAARSHTVLPAGPKQVWITEIGWSTGPRNPIEVLSRSVQALFLPQAYYELWSQGVTHVFWFQLVDPSPAGGDAEGMGLYTATGSAKPSVAEYRFPFMSFQNTNGTSTIWGKAPRTGTVLIQARSGGGAWSTIITLHTSSGGVFYDAPHLNPALSVRAVIGSFTSPVWPGK